MATKAKYFRVKEQAKKEDKPQTDILMRFNDSYGRYVTRALNLFFGENKSFVTIKAAERLSDKALWVAEVVKRRVEGLHQINNITEKEIVDIYEPKEEGLVRVQQKRYLTILEVTLTKNPSQADKKSAGYQPPLELKKDEFLTKQKWEQQEKERAERVQKRKERPNNEERRGEERKRGGGRDRRR